MKIKTQSWRHATYYVFFGLASSLLMIYYLSRTIWFNTSGRQFPIDSFSRFPLTYIIFPAEVFSLIFGLYFVYTLLSDWRRNPVPEQLKNKKSVSVAFLLPVYNEPKDIVERTIRAVKKVSWAGKKRIYLLDDSTTLADRTNMNALAKKYGAKIVRREDRTGYKAGNINNALVSAVSEPYFVILDADQAPEPEFLERTMDYFSDENVAFVQTPQHFVNDNSNLERAIKVGTNIFYQAMCVSKSKDGAMPFCGTNAVTRTDVFKEVNGFSYYTATEDLELGIRMNEAGYYGVFVPEVLVTGYAPSDIIAYSSQQYRWANGNLAVLRESWKNLLFGPFSFKYQVHMFFTLGWWLIGLVTLAYILTPLLSFFLGGTHHTWLPTALVAWVYLHVVLGIGMIYVSLHNRTDEPMTMKDALLEYSLITNSLFIYAKAAVNAFLKRYIGFIRTNKKRAASSMYHIRWNLILGAICFTFSSAALFNASRAQTFEQFRTFLPISLWLFFYAMILFSAILFVGGDADGENA